MPWGLQGRVGVVMGASSAIGRELVSRLVNEHHMRLACVSRKDLTALVPPGCVCLKADLAVSSDADSVMKSVVDTLGPVSLLVNCAGVTLNKMHVRCTDDDYNAVMDVNLRGALHVTRAVLRHGGMLKNADGCVIHIGSVVGRMGNEGQVIYSASKAALSAAVKSWAREYGLKNLRFNVIAPGLIEGEGMGLTLTEEQREMWRKRCSMGRLATVEDVVDAIIGVSTCRFINGQTLHVDGGMQSSLGSTAWSDKVRRGCDPKLPSAVIEKHTKVSNYSNSTATALAGELQNSIRLLRGYSATLHYCSDEIEGALLTLGVNTTHSLLSSINGVIEGLEAVAGTCKAMCESHFEEVRQREDLFVSLCNMYEALKERHEFTEREMRSVVAERDRQNAAFSKAISYVETLIAERAIWEEKNGYNCVGLPLIEKTFSESCHEALDMFDRIEQETSSRTGPNLESLISSTDTPDILVERWEAIENLRHTNGIPSARVQYVPPGDEVQLLREVLAMGTGGRALLRDVREEQRNLEEARKKVRELGVSSLATLQTARGELNAFKEWLLSLKQSGQPFNASFEKLRGMMTNLEHNMNQKLLMQDMSSSGA